MEHNLVTISNTFVQASYSLTLVEKRLILACIGIINNDISANRDNLEVLNSDTYYSISVKDYADIYGITYEKAKDELSAAVDRLYEREVRYIDSDGNKVRTRWISTTIRYDKEEHSINIAWAKGIIPLISELRRNFTSYKLRFLSVLTSTYSIRWYELLVMELSRSQKSEVTVEIAISTIRTMFELHNKYTLFADFAKRVIDAPLKEIDKANIGNIYVSILDSKGKKMYIKEGKRIIGLKIRVRWRDNECSPVEKKKQAALLKKTAKAVGMSKVDKERIMAGSKTYSDEIKGKKVGSLGW